MPHKHFNINKIMLVGFCKVGLIDLDQGSSNLSLEGQSAAEFSSNPDKTHLPVIF